MSKIVCFCRSVTLEVIQQAIKNGNDTLEKVCKATGAGLGCYSCHPEILSLLEQYHTNQKKKKSNQLELF